MTKLYLNIAAHYSQGIDEETIESIKEDIEDALRFTGGPIGSGIIIETEVVR